MNEPKHLADKVGFVFCAALLGTLAGCTTYVEQPRSQGGYYPEPPPPREVYVPPPAVQVEASIEFGIRAESDFYEPLSPYGRWEVVGSYGRCWIPGRVEANWRPYSNGYWQRTDAGWYWVSDEPWGWATYHYGRWDLSARFGWYWVPQTQWAPAWVSWREGGGYIGWSPLQPSARFSASGSLDVNVALIAPRAYVFVEQRHFLQPVRPATVVVNNTTIINNTVNITNIKVVNNTVINEGPRTTVIEQASGQQVRAVPVREMRRKQEAEAVTRHRAASPGREDNAKTVQSPVRTEAAPRATKALQQSERRAQEAEASAQAQSQRRAKDAERATQMESQRRGNEAGAKAQEESQRNARGLEKKAQQETEQRATDSAVKVHEASQRNARGQEKKAQQVAKQPAKEKPAASEKGAAQLLKKDNKKKGKGKPSPEEAPPVTPPASP